MAEQDKVQREAKVWIDTATGIASAWAQSATLPTLWFGASYTALMLPIAAVQANAIRNENVTKPAPSTLKHRNSDREESWEIMDHKDLMRLWGTGYPKPFYR